MGQQPGSVPGRRAEPGRGRSSTPSNRRLPRRTGPFPPDPVPVAPVDRYPTAAPSRAGPDTRAAALDACRRHIADLWAMASLILDDPDRTETALSATVRSVWESPAQVPFGGDGERAALAGVVYRCCQQVAAAVVDGIDAPRAQGTGSQGTGSLTADERSAFALAALGDHSYRDVARVVGADPPAVVSQLRSVLRRLSP